MIAFTLPKWFDLHVHLRQEVLLAPVIQEHLSAGCAGVLAMPNTKPPVAKVFDKDALNCWSIERYLEQIKNNGGDCFETIIIPLYLTKETTAKMISDGAQAGLLKACKYYPPHGTTGAEFSTDIDALMQQGVFEAMEAEGVVLCIHGEEHNLTTAEYFARNSNAEEIFYQTSLPKIRKAYPNLKMVCEHLTTKVAVEFVKANPSNTAATVTPQHLLYTIGDLVKGLKYHLYCLPLLKFEEDRTSLREAVTDPNNQQFFAGTDSAPHTHKTTECGCAAGCYTAAIGPQLYAQAFETAGNDLSLTENQAIFKRFLCELGPAFYGLEPSKDTFTLHKTQNEATLIKTDNGPLTPLSTGLNFSLNWEISA